MNTPEEITDLPEGSVFVFGSNAEGRHAGGAAKVAAEKFGAVWGVGEGLEGQSYALPTMGSDKDLAEAVARFLYFAATHRYLTFYVTKVGTGIAGRSIGQVAPLFADAAPNVILPMEFEVFA